MSWQRKWQRLGSRSKQATCTSSTSMAISRERKWPEVASAAAGAVNAETNLRCTDTVGVRSPGREGSGAGDLTPVCAH